ncbi:MAG: DUF1499 domain-containing protein [Devosia sp.]
MSTTTATGAAAFGSSRLMRILVRTSKWAVWSRRLATLALPLVIIPIFLHRSRIIASNDFILVEAVALSVAGIAFIAAIVAFVRLWFTGDQGWGRAVVALLFSLLCLGPVAFLAWETLHYPEAADVTTDFANPPQLRSFVTARFVTPEERARIEAAFPNARSRNYPIAAPQMFDVVSDLIDDRGWELRSKREPQTPLDSGELNALVTTILGFRQEVAIRLVGSPDGATIIMRSASLTNFPDFGENGQRIEAFLLDLDNQVTLMLRDASRQPQADN